MRRQTKDMHDHVLAGKVLIGCVEDNNDENFSLI